MVISMEIVAYILGKYDVFVNMQICKRPMLEPAEKIGPYHIFIEVVIRKFKGKM